MKTIGILGCGWLGLPLAKSLLQNGFIVRGSRTTKEGVTLLNTNGISGFLLQIDSNQIQGDISFFQALDVLVISIPPKRNHLQFDLFKSLHALIHAVKKQPQKKLIFLSSTSVYGDHSGQFDEESNLQPISQNAKTLVECEQLLFNTFSDVIIVRLGGLIGEDRNPIAQLQNKIISNPEGFINFIHQHDAVEGIVALILKQDIKGVFNLVTPHHPTRKTFYLFSAKKMGYPTPQFSLGTSIKRIIEAKKITVNTPFRYRVNNLLI